MNSTPEQKMINSGWIPLPNKCGEWSLNDLTRKAYHQSLFEDAKKSDKEIYQKFKEQLSSLSEEVFESLFGHLNH